MKKIVLALLLISVFASPVLAGERYHFKKYLVGMNPLDDRDFSYGALVRVNDIVRVGKNFHFGVGAIGTGLLDHAVDDHYTFMITGDYYFDSPLIWLLKPKGEQIEN